MAGKLAGSHPLPDRRTIAAHFNDAAFHLKLAEQSLEQAETVFTGHVRAALQQQIGGVRKVRRAVMAAMSEAGIRNRAGTDGRRRTWKRP